VPTPQTAALSPQNAVPPASGTTTVALAPQPAAAASAAAAPDARVAAAPAAAGGSSVSTGGDRSTAPQQPAPPDKSPASNASGSDADYGVVTVFYGTDRAPMAGPPPASGFSGWWWWTACSTILPAGLALAAWRAQHRRAWVIGTGAGLALTLLLAIVAASDGMGGVADAPLKGTNYGPDRGSLALGTCRVSVPKARQLPRLDPASLVALGLHVDLSKNQVLLDVQPSPEENFYRDLKARVAASSRKEAFVYVHGFNNSFADAAVVAAELAVDLKFDGAPVVYSWPSQAELVDYTVDECNVAWTQPHFKAFLLALARQSGATSIHLIAHSMGNRALTSVLEEISEEMRDSTHLFRQVVLAAPDIDADTFRQEIAPAIVKTADRVTLYASSSDQALALSKRVHGYPRAGESGEQLVVVPGVDTIDVSAVDTGLIGHDYYTDSSGVVADLVDVIQGALPPQKRPWLLPKQADALTYWIFTKASQALSRAPSSTGYK
jgi:esterase/lipase superfamily enzyme